MTYSFKHRLILSAVVSCFPLLASAQASLPPIVPPPTMPGTASSAPVQVSQPPSQKVAKTAIELPIAPPSVATPAVSPPQGVSNTNKTGIIDLALPDAPKASPEDLKADLKPSAPKKPKAERKPKEKKIKTDAPAEPEKVVTAKLPQDPYAGILGTPVSNSQLNRFVFPEAVEGLYFQENAPLPTCAEDAKEQDPCKPVFLNGGRVMLLQLRAGAKGPVQMVVHLASGRIETMNLMPDQGPGAIIRLDGAEDGPSEARLAAAKNAMGQPQQGMAGTEQNVALLSRFARGDIPVGFESLKVGKPSRYQYFDVIPMAVWRNDVGQRVSMLQVVARSSAPVAINEGLFRHPGVKALALDKKTITNTAPATLYVLETIDEVR